MQDLDHGPGLTERNEGRVYIPIEPPYIGEFRLACYGVNMNTQGTGRRRDPNLVPRPRPGKKQSYKPARRLAIADDIRMPQEKGRPVAKRNDGISWKALGSPMRIAGRRGGLLKFTIAPGSDQQNSQETRGPEDGGSM